MSDHPNAPGADDAPPRGETRAARRVLPHSLEAERAVLGVLLLDARRLPAVRREVDAASFYHPAHQAIFQAACDVADAGAPVDAITIAGHMKKAGTFGRLRAVNGEAYFVDLTSDVVTGENVTFHARMVRNFGTVRKIVEAAQEIARDGYDVAAISAQEFVSAAARTLVEIARGGASTKLVTQAESVRAAEEEIKQAYLTREAARTNPAAAQGPGIRTGLCTVDEMTAGGIRREYIVLAGRPGMGKTSVAMDIAEGAARYNDCGVLVISLEMRHAALTRRRLAAATGINGYALRAGDLTPDNWRALATASSRLAELPIWYHDHSRRLSQVMSIARAWATDPDQGGRFKHRLIMTDYVQLLERDVESGRRQWSNAEQEVREASRELAALRGDCDAAVIGLSQLNREVESRDPPIPVMSDLRQSGALEQDADIVGLLYRAHYYRKDTDEMYRLGVDEEYPVMRLILGKFRDGEPGTRFLGWDGARTRCFDLPDGWKPPEPVTTSKRRARGGNQHARAGEDDA